MWVFCQWGKTYDYRNPHLEILSGTYAQAKAATHPMKVLFSIVPLSAVPAHSLGLVEDLLVKNDISASQLGCTSDLLSAIIVPVIVQFAESGDVVDGWNVNLYRFAKPLSLRFIKKVF